MNFGSITSDQLCLGAIGLLGIGWGCVRASRRGEGVLGIFIRVLVSLGMVGGLVLMIGPRLAGLTGDVSADTISILTIVAAVSVGGVLLSLFWVPAVADVVAAPLTNIFDGGHEEPERKPAYSAARFQREAGRADRAIDSVRAELAKFPDDFEGVMLLAEIQAKDAGDLAAAESTFEMFIRSPKALPAQVVVARTKLASWYIERNDRNAAITELKRIIAQFPDSEHALLAEQRIRELAATSPDETLSAPVRAEPGKVAAVYLKQLKANPADFAAREKLALLYAREFRRLDLATMELEQLIRSPSHPGKQRARWLKLLAKLQIESKAAPELIEATFQRLVTEFPEDSETEKTRQRLEQFRRGT